MTTFQHLVPLFHLCLLFLVVRAQSAVLTWFGLSFHPFGLLKVLCPSVRQVRCIFYFFAILHLCLSFWMGRCENHGPSRGRVENRICSLRMQRGKKVGERDGWMKGGRECGVASDVRPFKGESGNQSRPWPTWCFVPLSTSRHLSVSLFLEESFILLFFFSQLLLFHTAYLAFYCEHNLRIWKNRQEAPL